MESLRREKPGDYCRKDNGSKWSKHGHTEAKLHISSIRVCVADWTANGMESP